MIRLTTITDTIETVSDTLTLSFDARSKARLLAKTDGGSSVGLFLPRGLILRDGQCLTGPEEIVIRICSAPENLSIVRPGSPIDCARACYHLGNRHVALQILADELRYLADSVLDEMVRRLGLPVYRAELPFEPEAGAYSEHSHG